MIQASQNWHNSQIKCSHFISGLLVLSEDQCLSSRVKHGRLETLVKDGGRGGGGHLGVDFPEILQIFIYLFIYLKITTHIEDYRKLRCQKEWTKLRNCNKNTNYLSFKICDCRNRQYFSGRLNGRSHTIGLMRLVHWNLETEPKNGKGNNSWSHVNIPILPSVVVGTEKLHCLISSHKLPGFGFLSREKASAPQLA